MLTGLVALSSVTMARCHGPCVHCELLLTSCLMHTAMLGVNPPNTIHVICINSMHEIINFRALCMLPHPCAARACTGASKARDSCPICHSHPTASACTYCAEALQASAGSMTGAHRSLFMQGSHRTLLSACAGHKGSGSSERATSRRDEALATLRRMRRRRRSLLTARESLNTNHLSNLTGVTVNTTASTLLGSDVACVLEPTVTQGPYYVDGELIREDVREDQGALLGMLQACTACMHGVFKVWAVPHPCRGCIGCTPCACKMYLHCA